MEKYIGMKIYRIYTDSIDFLANQIGKYGIL